MRVRMYVFRSVGVLVVKFSVRHYLPLSAPLSGRKLVCRWVSGGCESALSEVFGIQCVCVFVHARVRARGTDEKLNHFISSIRERFRETHELLQAGKAAAAGQ